MLFWFGDNTSANWPDFVPGSIDETNVFVKWTLLCGFATANGSDTKNDTASADMAMIAKMTNLFTGWFWLYNMFKRF
jgi:hypothetical protein